MIDLAHYLVGEIASVAGAVRTFTPVRDGTEVDVDDAFAATVEFSEGALGTIEASRYCAGRKNGLRFEINGTAGSLAFNLERLNELELSEGAAGFRTILVTDPEHPFLRHWWPAGHVLGWEHTFVHELHHLLTAIRDDDRWDRTVPRSRTAIARPRCATRSFARQTAPGGFRSAIASPRRRGERPDDRG